MPAALVLIAVNWLWPLAWALGLVYLHPLMALWFLDREIGRMQPAWRPAYRGSLLLVPLCLAALWWNLAGSPNLPGRTCSVASLPAGSPSTRGKESSRAFRRTF